MVVSRTIARHLCAWSLIVSTRKAVSIVEMAGRLETVLDLPPSCHTQPPVVCNIKDCKYYCK